MGRLTTMVQAASGGSSVSGPVEAVSMPVSPGELIDKITILEIKKERIVDADKRSNVMRELALLYQVRDAAIAPSARLDEFTERLKAINGKLWDIENEIRRRERENDFGRGFIMLARAIYHNNDERAEFKRRINTLLGAGLTEEKFYVSY
jgi:hypothetical protein